MLLGDVYAICVIIVVIITEMLEKKKVTLNLQNFNLLDIFQL